MAASLHNLGLVFIRREDFNHAQEYFMQSLAIKERLSPGSLTVSDTLERLGRVTMNRGDLEAAEVYFLRALTITAQLAPGTEREAIDLTDLGIIAGQRINCVA